jgi:hypothetical protein
MLAISISAPHRHAGFSVQPGTQRGHRNSDVILRVGRIENNYLILLVSVCVHEGECTMDIWAFKRPGAPLRSEKARLAL